MTYRTPVLISDDPIAMAAAQARGWKVLLRDEQLLRFAGLDRSQTLALPPLPFSIDDGSLTPATAGGWDNLLNWLQKHIHQPMLIVAPDEWAAELALWAAASRGWPFGIWIDGAPPLHTPTAAACMLSNDGLFAPRPEALADLSRRWKEPFAELPATPLIHVPDRPQPAPSRRDEGGLRVLVVDHHGEAPALADPGVVADFATAVRRDGERTHVVADLGAPGLATQPGALPPWAVVTLEGEKGRPVASSDFVGGHWRWRVENHFDARDDHFDVVWLRGEPYVTADLALYAKRRWYARVILDPHTWARFETEGERAQVAYDTAGWEMWSDVVLTGDETSEQIMGLIKELGDHTYAP